MRKKFAASAFVIVIGVIAAILALTLGHLTEGPPSTQRASTDGRVAAAEPAVEPARIPATAPASPDTNPPATAPETTTTTIYTHPIAEPKRIVIPAIEVDATIVNVGVQDDGFMEVPDFGYAAWFSPGPAPGDFGPAVVVAHVDSKKGPDVFYRLRELEQGDLVLISDENGDTATFAVEWSEMVLKTELPTDRIWNDTPEPVIRLITCGGEFDRASGHYRSNFIVYGYLVE